MHVQLYISTTLTLRTDVERALGTKVDGSPTATGCLALCEAWGRSVSGVTRSRLGWIQAPPLPTRMTYLHDLSVPQFPKEVGSTGKKGIDQLLLSGQGHVQDERLQTQVTVLSSETGRTVRSSGLYPVDGTVHNNYYKNDKT